MSEELYSCNMADSDETELQMEGEGGEGEEVEMPESKEGETEEEPAMSPEDIERARIEAEKEKGRQERLVKDTPANKARVDFRAAQPKDIVSHHAGSILAHDGPVVPLTDDMLERAQEAFRELAITLGGGEGEEGGEEGEAEAEVEVEAEGGEEAEEKQEKKEKMVKPPPVIEANRLAQALYRCGATPINIDSLTQLTGVSGALATETKEEDAEEDGGDGEGDDGDSVKKATEDAAAGSKDRRGEILRKAIALFSDRKASAKSAASEEKTADAADMSTAAGLPEGSMEEADFLNFVSEFFAPSYYYGQRLRRFVARGCVDDALLLLARGCNVNTSDGEGLSSLHYASEFNKVEMIRQLHAFSQDGLKVNAKDKAGWTPLYCAVHHGSVEAVETLLGPSLKADVAASTILGKSPLHAAAGQGRLAIANILLENSADASQQDFKGMTPLHDAAYKLHEELYELIKEHKTCDPGVKEELGYTAEEFFTGHTGVDAGAENSAK